MFFFLSSYIAAFWRQKPRCWKVMFFLASAWKRVFFSGEKLEFPELEISAYDFPMTTVVLSLG